MAAAPPAMPALLLACCVLAALAASASAKNNKPPCRVLSIVTNVGEWTPTTGPAAGIGKPKPTGYWLSEFTHSYTEFTKAGCKVTVASPKGGVGAADPQGFLFYAQDPDTQALVKKNTTNGQTVQYIPQTQSTVALSSIKNLDDFDIVFFVGGTGAMWDFKGDDNIKRIVRGMWEKGKIVSSVCHGYMALTDVTMSNGKLFLDGKTVTGFSNKEEESVGKANVCALCGSPYDPTCDPKTCDGPFMPKEYPAQGTYLIEDRATENGARYVSTYQDWVTFHYRPHIVRHGRLVTGQNPGAARETAQAVIDTFNILKKCGSKVVAAQYADTLCTGLLLPQPVTCYTVGHTVDAKVCAESDASADDDTAVPPATLTTSAIANTTSNATVLAPATPPAPPSNSTSSAARDLVSLPALLHGCMLLGLLLVSCC